MGDDDFGGFDPAVELDGVRVFAGDCRVVLAKLPADSVDSIVTDPPYELGFMGKGWDSSGIAYDVTVWAECLRVLKPGGHLLAFGGSRTWHRLAVAVEDAGFEIRDNIAWIYGSGFPKSLDVSKAIDKRAGAEREVVGERIGVVKGTGGRYNWHTDENSTGQTIVKDTIPATSEAKAWEGWGTALKPAHEPVVVGRKPLGGKTVAENVLEWGVGGLNIDGSRILAKDAPEGRSRHGGGIAGNGTSYELPDSSSSMPEGRWPANVILDEVTAGLLDEQSGVLKSGAKKPLDRKSPGGVYEHGRTVGNLNNFDADTGGASRFFYVAKSSKRDRNEGLEELEDKRVGTFEGSVEQKPGRKIGRNRNKPNLPGKNTHPTVKPTALMRYLVKLVTPPGGTVLDPFTGSGSTGKAAILEGFEFVGVELTEDYLPIIEGRLKWALENRDEGALF